VPINSPVSAARFPLRAEEIDIVRDRLLAEAAAARQLAGRTRFPTPEPDALAEPGAGYPLPWAVRTWLTGTVATERDPGESTTFAQDLAEFIYSVRAIDRRRPDIHRPWPRWRSTHSR
jgi:aminoglycoside phosphotransferase (APT) family kinase protein